MHGYFHRKEMPRYIPKNVPIIRRKPLWASQVDGDMLIGKVKKVSRIGLDKIDCLHVSVPENSFFDYGLLFYRTAKFHWALDPESKGALGDVVLIRKATEEQQFTSTVPYYVDRVVFKYGSMIDPISKRVNYPEGVYQDEAKFRKQILDKLYNDPLGDEEITYERKRSLIKERIAQKREKKFSHKEESSD